MAASLILAATIWILNLENPEINSRAYFKNADIFYTGLKTGDWTVPETELTIIRDSTEYTISDSLNHLEEIVLRPNNLISQSISLPNDNIASIGLWYEILGHNLVLGLNEPIFEVRLDDRVIFQHLMGEASNGPTFVSIPVKTKYENLQFKLLYWQNYQPESIKIWGVSSSDVAISVNEKIELVSSESDSIIYLNYLDKNGELKTLESTGTLEFAPEESLQGKQIRYWSVDSAGNIEKKKTAYLTVYEPLDSTVIEAKLFLEGDDELSAVIESSSDIEKQLFLETALKLSDQINESWHHPICHHSLITTCNYLNNFSNDFLFLNIPAGQHQAQIFIKDRFGHTFAISDEQTLAPSN